MNCYVLFVITKWLMRVIALFITEFAFIFYAYYGALVTNKGMAQDAYILRIFRRIVLVA